MDITIIGAGAIGGVTGAFLTHAGYNVTVVDIVQEHLDAINRDGLRISGVRGDHRYPLRAIHADDLPDELETVILAVKGHFTQGVVSSIIAPRLRKTGCVVSFQNGLNEHTLTQLIGPERTIGAFVHFGADYLEPGHIQLGQEQDIFLGEIDGAETPRVRALQSALNNVMPTHVTNDIFGYLWGKLVYGSMAFAVSTVDATIPEVLSDPRGHIVARAASIETASVGAALGHALQPIGRFDPNAFLPADGLLERASRALDQFQAEMAGSIKQHMGIWRDLKIRKRKTEVDVQCGVVVEQGATLGIDVPVNQAIVEVIHEIEEGHRGMESANLDVLLAAVPEQLRSGRR